MLPDCSREYLLKKISWGSMPPNPPSKLTAAPLDRQIAVFSGKTQSHAWSLFILRTLTLYLLIAITNLQAAKICNNMLLAINMIGTAETMNMGVK